MYEIAKHQLAHIDRLAAHRGDSDVDIVTAMFFELGPDPSQGAVTSWLWNQLVEAGLEGRSEHHDAPEAVAAWASIEAGEEDAPALTVEQFKAIVECGKARGSRVRLDFGDGK